MASNHLPQELIDLILDNLHDDINSLKSCSLAAHTMVTSARTLIFRKIEIKPPDPLSSSLNTCQRFYKLLTACPHIAPIVEELCVVTVGSETSFGYTPDGEYLPERLRISLTENAPYRSDGWKNSMSWHKMGQRLTSALATVFSSPRLEAVHLRGIVIGSPYELLSLFSEATALKEMSLSRLYFTQRAQRDMWPESQPWRPQLRSLLIADNCDNFSPSLVNPRIDLTHVRSLTLAMDLPERREKVLQATKSGSGGVEHLRLWCMGSDWTRNQDVFSANLRSIHFFSRSPFWLLSAFLQACPHDSRLECITVEDRPSSQPYEPPEFEVDDSTLAHFRSLKVVEIKLFMTPNFPLAGWEEAVRAGFPSLVRRGLLRVTQSEWPIDGAHEGWE
ncbi:hypothetical protein B0H13DRAFT_2496199 [Mycena leptocephala]|nr:hypothetical protein B0H13DRAFT_2496199 [Mycena leptocephala]